MQKHDNDHDDEPEPILDEMDDPAREIAAPTQIGLEARISAIITPTLTDLGYELVRVSVLGRERPTVQIMADRADGNLINIDDCQAISRNVSAVMDVNDPIPGRWTLEVSSAGIDRPLTRLKDWVRFIGHLARIELIAPVEGRRRMSAVIVAADATTLKLRDGVGEFDVPFADVRRAKLVLTDELIAASAPQPTPTAN